MTTPTPAAVAVVAELQRDAMWQVPCEACGCSTWMNSDDAARIVTLALDTAAAKVWEEAAKRFAECAAIARQTEQEPDSAAYWAHEGMYRAYKHAESIATQESRAAEARR